LTEKFAYQLVVRGLVQGIGFRPYVYRLALSLGICGYIRNSNFGVTIVIEGKKEDLKNFQRLLPLNSPAATIIDSLDTIIVTVHGYSTFEIIKSSDSSNEITFVSPDIAVCPECIKDMHDQMRRNNYSFVNCTNCGPRFSIIKSLPYDRANTTMNEFAMCDDCKTEYHDINNRRFHAQPIACNECGPGYSLITKTATFSTIEKIIQETCALIDSGVIVAIKGMGGFHIACDAHNEKVVRNLRERKNREKKPFAVMFRDTEAINQYAIVNQHEKDTLTSWRSPIVLLKSKHTLAPSVNPGFNTIGAMLPYMPIHYQLMENLKTDAIVLTSGNISDEPIVTDNVEVCTKLGPIVDAFLVHNRKIHNRTDDSVVFVSDNKVNIIRRSRGYAPAPIKLNIEVEGIFAAGAEMTNTFCLGRHCLAIMSQYIGDIKNTETLAFYTETVKRFFDLYRFKIEVAACDKHPDYLSSSFSKDIATDVIFIQHHHAHIASVMAEHKINEPILGIVMDGTGYGDDGTIWGGEFLQCSLSDYQRLSYFEPIYLPGGDKVVEEPWRTAVSLLYQIYGKDFLSLPLPFLKLLDRTKIELILEAIDKRINCPLSSSAGRLFDAVAALTGICIESNFHAEAPMKLESLADFHHASLYRWDDNETLSFSPTFKGIVEDIVAGHHKQQISGKFHRTIALAVSEKASILARKYKLKKVALSGGCFQNRILLSLCTHHLHSLGFKVYFNQQVPCNDGGISLGQLAIAGTLRK
jgi:hydrogenase maturation protein HypF